MPKAKTITKQNITEEQIDEVWAQTHKIINNVSREDAITFVKVIVEQLNIKHGDSFDKGGFEFATLYFP